MEVASILILVYSHCLIMIAINLSRFFLIFSSFGSYCVTCSIVEVYFKVYGFDDDKDWEFKTLIFEP